MRRWCGRLVSPSTIGHNQHCIKFSHHISHSPFPTTYVFRFIVKLKLSEQFKTFLLRRHDPVSQRRKLFSQIKHHASPNCRECLSKIQLSPSCLHSQNVICLSGGILRPMSDSILNRVKYFFFTSVLMRIIL